MPDQLFPVTDVDAKRFVNKYEPIPQTKEESRRNLQKALSLQEPPVSHLVRNNAERTSVEAAAKVRPKVGKLELVVLNLLHEHSNGLTIDQMVELSGLSYNSISPRPSKLIKKELIYVSGQGLSAMGNKANIYKIKER
jgi:hypothetical protein